MATLTYDPTPADQPEFNEAEQEALQIGEQAQAEQNQMLAGKFKDAEALEQAYIELQKKLGESDEDNSVSEVQESDDEVPVPTEAQQAILSASEEYYANDGKLSDETIAKLSAMDSAELLNAYMAAQGNQPSVEISAEDTSAIQDIAGGPKAYGDLMQWAGESLPENVIDGFDSLVDSGNPIAIQLAVRGLMAEYEAQNGMEGQMLSGKAAPGKQDVFRSQSEVVQAMSDPRYDRDPAYRQDVFDKLNRSNIEY